MFRFIPYPEGFTLFGQPGLSLYSIMLMAAFLTASFLAPRELRRRGLDAEAADYSLLLAVVGAIVGSKVFFIVEIWDKVWYNRFGFWDTFTSVFFTWEGMAARFPQQATGMWPNLLTGGGLVFYGGFIFAFSMVYFYLRRKGYSVWRYGDAYMPSLALGYAIGRLGCFFSGDGCFGHGAGANIPLLTWVYGPGEGGCSTDPNAWWLPYMCTDGVRVWNTPVMESIMSLGLFFLMMFWARKQNFRPGMLVAIFLIYNGVARFAVEFLRITDAVIPLIARPIITYQGIPVANATPGDFGSMPPREFFDAWHWYGLTQAQIIAISLLVIGVAWIIIGKLYKKDDAEPARAGG